MADPETGDLKSSEDQLPEEIFTDQTEFLNAIHPSFLKQVYPIESRLVDALRASSVFDSDDEDSIRAEKTRRDKARKCWSLLKKVLPHQFSSCFSALKATCAPVVGGKTFRRDDVGGGEGCVRHVIQRRMSLRRFADVFPGAAGCSDQEYRKMMEGSDMDDSLWDRAFKLCSKNKDNEVFLTMMKTTLTTTQITVPGDLQALVAMGFPCSCQKTVPQTKGKKRKRSKKKKKSHKRCKRFHGVTDCPVDTDKHAASRHEVIVSPKASSSMTATALGSAAAASSSAHAPPEEDIHMLSSSQQSMEETTENEDACQECCFETQEQKDTFLKRLEEVNTAITKASSIKALFQEAAGIQLELTALTQPTRSDPVETKHLEEKGKTHRLHVKIRDLKTKLEKAHEEATLTWEETEKMAATTKLPDQHLKALSDRRELLARKLNQADDFYHQSAKIFRQLNLDTINQEQAEENAEQDADSYDGDSSYERKSFDILNKSSEHKFDSEEDVFDLGSEWEILDILNESSEHEFDSEEEVFDLGSEWEILDILNESSEHEFDSEEDGFDFDTEEVYEVDDDDFDEKNGDGSESYLRDTHENDGNIYRYADEYVVYSDISDGSIFHDDNDGSDFDGDVDANYSSDFEDYDEF